MNTIQFGAHYAPISRDGRTGPMEAAVQAEEWGYDSFWVPETLTRPQMDPLVLLAAIAQRTQRIRLGTAVLILPIRSPFHLTKAAVSVAALSNERFTLGVGVGGPAPKDFEVEGVDLRQRGRISDENLDILHRLLSETNVSYQGRYRQFTDVTMKPDSVHAPPFPIWIGGSWHDGIADGVLRRAARYANGFLTHDTPIEGYRRAQTKIKEYARSYGRDLDGFEWATDIYTYLADSKEQAIDRLASEMKEHPVFSPELHPENGYGLGTPGDCIEAIERYVDLGINHIILFPVCPPDQMMGEYEVLAKEVIPHFRSRSK